MLDSSTEFLNECTYKPWGLSIIIIIKLHPDRALAMTLYMMIPSHQLIAAFLITAAGFDKICIT